MLSIGKRKKSSVEPNLRILFAIRLAGLAIAFGAPERYTESFHRADQSREVLRQEHRAVSDLAPLTALVVDWLGIQDGQWDR